MTVLYRKLNANQYTSLITNFEIEALSDILVYTTPSQDRKKVNRKARKKDEKERDEAESNKESSALEEDSIQESTSSVRN